MSSHIQEGLSHRVRRALDRILGNLLALILATMVIDVLWQIVSRFLLGAPSSWTEELARYLLIWLGLFGAAYAFGRRHHLAVDLLPRRLGPAAARRLARVSDLAVAVFALAVPTLGGGALVRLAADLGQRSAALGVPLAWVYTALPVSGAATLAYVILGPPDDRGILDDTAGEAGG